MEGIKRLGLFNNVNTELYFIYGLIAVVIILIIVVVMIDKKDNKKSKKKSLSDTMTLKPIKDDFDTKYKEVEVIDMISKKNIEEAKKEFNEKTMEFQKIDPSKYDIPTKQPEKPIIRQDTSYTSHEVVKEVPSIKYYQEELDLDDIEEEIYHDDDLEKTQAQIRVEEITKALEDAKVDEQIEKDKYSMFEEEQEKNAIISYDELKESYDKLYEENEKRQYLEDDQIPINIDELYELSYQSDEEPIEEIKTQIEELSLDDTASEKDYEHSKLFNDEKVFKTTPYISPVYGIQQNKQANMEKRDLEESDMFLDNLKELRDNLNSK